MKYLLSTITLLLFLNNSVWATDMTPEAEKDYRGELQILVMGLPVFEDYRIEEAKVILYQEPRDWSAYEDTTLFQAALEKGPTFAGKYTIVSKGCGSACIQHWIMDVTNGDIITNFTSQGGIYVQKNSRLLIKNFQAGDSTNLVAGAVSEYPISFYEFIDEELKLIKTVDPHNLIQVTK